MGTIVLRKHGREVGVSEVDDADHPWLNQWPWLLHGSGYVARMEGKRAVYMHREILSLGRGDATALRAEHMTHSEECR